jgi:hypothetical protein
MPMARDNRWIKYGLNDSQAAGPEDQVGAG